METNLTDLMSKVSELKREFMVLENTITRHALNEKIIELNGNEQIIQEYPDFKEHFDRFNFLADEIAKLKGIIFEKNHEFKLSNGLNIQEALVYIENKRVQINMMKELVRMYPSKKRIIENNNSHFVAKELNYDRKEMEKMATDLLEEIQELEFEISKLNSKTFTI